MKRAALALAALALTGCGTVGVNVYADLSEQLGGRVTHYLPGVTGDYGPYARAGVEVDAQVIGGFKVAAGIEHYSFPLVMEDRGEERAYIGARYRWQVKP